MNHSMRYFSVKISEPFSVLISTACALKTDQSSNPGMLVTVGIAVFVGLSVGTGDLVCVAVGTTCEGVAAQDASSMIMVKKKIFVQTFMFCTLIKVIMSRCAAEQSPF